MIQPLDRIRRSLFKWKKFFCLFSCFRVLRLVRKPHRPERLSCQSIAYHFWPILRNFPLVAIKLRNACKLPWFAALFGSALWMRSVGREGMEKGYFTSPASINLLLRFKLYKKSFKREMKPFPPAKQMRKDFLITFAWFRDLYSSQSRWVNNFVAKSQTDTTQSLGKSSRKPRLSVF